MIKEQCCTAETFELLRQVGYPPRELENQSGYYIPTQAQAMRWLRDRHYMYVDPYMDNYETRVWGYAIYDISPAEEAIEFDGDYPYPTYEAAAEAGIRAACEYLIASPRETAPTNYCPINEKPSYGDIQ